MPDFTRELYVDGFLLHLPFQTQSLPRLMWMYLAFQHFPNPCFYGYMFADVCMPSLHRLVYRNIFPDVKMNFSAYHVLKYEIHVLIGLFDDNQRYIDFIDFLRCLIGFKA